MGMGMSRSRLLKFFEVLMVTSSLFMSSCLSQPGSGTSRSKVSKGVTTNTPRNNNTDGGNPSAPGNDSVGNSTDQILTNGQVELRHFVDPFDGTYKTKVTIPKNFTGLLYLCGINVSSLTSKVVSVRFRFGRD